MSPGYHFIASTLQGYLLVRRRVVSCIMWWIL